MALRLPRQTVLRAGYGMNYTVSMYGTFASTMARQPMVNQPTLVNEQTNLASNPGAFTLANGFPTPNAVGNYALQTNYRLPYVQVYNLDIQKTWPWGIVMNIGYNGSMGSHLDITSAPRATVASPSTDPGNVPFNYEQSSAFSRFNAGTVRVNKRLGSGIAVGANYQYSHSIDDAGSVGGTSSVVAQNWQDLGAEEGNSSFDVRHQVSGTYLYELPFGKDKRWVTTGTAAHFLEGFSVSGSYTFATGEPLTPSYSVAVSDVAHGTAGTLRPNRVPNVSSSEGGGSLKNGSTPPPSPSPHPTPSATHSAMPHATPSPALAPSPTAWRSPKPCSSATPAVWSSAPPPTTSSTPSNTPASTPISTPQPPAR